MIKIYPNQMTGLHFGTSDVKQNQNVSKPDGLKQGDKISNITADYNVKVPMGYTKTGVINLPNGIEGQCYKLANGQRVVIVPKKGETTINTIVNTGSMNEPDNLRGISHYIEHNLFNGSEGLEAGEFFKRVNRMGGSTNAATGFATTNYFITSNLLNDGDFEEMVKLHLSMLEAPKFTVETLKKEKPIVQSEINMITQEPSNISANKAIKNLYGIKSTSQDMIGGTVDNIENLKRDDVVKYYNDNYYPANMVTVVTGEVSEDEAINLISKYAKSKKIPKKPQYHESLTPIQQSVREDIISDKASSTSMMIAMNGPKNSDLKDNIALSIATRELFGGGSSKVNSRLVDKGLVVGAGSEKLSSDKNANSVTMIETSSNDEKIEIALRTISNEIEKLKQNPIDAERLEQHKKIINKSFIEAFESNDAINFGLSTMMLDYDNDTIQNYSKILNSITVDDVKNAVDKYLDTNKMSIVVTHPSSSTEESIKESYNNASQVQFCGNINNKKRTVTDLSKVEAFTFPNNVELTLNDSKSDISYLFYTLTTRDKNEKYALEAKILDEMINKGSTKQSSVEITQDLDKDAISLNCGVEKNGIAITADFYSGDVDKVFEKLNDLMYSPNLSEANFDKIKENLRADILNREPSAMRKINRELFPEALSGMTKEELLEKLDSLTLDDIKAFYEKLINEGQGVLTVTGPASSNREFKEALFKNTLNLPKTQKFKVEYPGYYREVAETKVFTETFNRPQAKIVEAFAFETSNNLKDTTTVALLNTILGGNPSSRLFMDLREKQNLAYRVSSSSTIMNDLGVIKLSIGTTTDNKETGVKTYDNVQKSIDGFNANIKKLMEEKVSDEELNNAKLSLKNALLSSVQTPMGETLNLAVLKNAPYGFTQKEQALEMIDKITADDIQNAANYIFSHKPMYSILATEDTINANNEYLEKLKD